MSAETKDSLRETIDQLLSQQISEFELLKAMYPNEHEITLTDDNIIDDIKKFIENKGDFAPSHLNFTINLQINKFKLEMCISLPTFYPQEEPDIYVRCNQLNRQQETKLNMACDVIKKDNRGDVCIYNVINWLQDNIIHIGDESNNDCNNVEESFNEISTDGTKFVRLWIYSHHIYNKKKRDLILRKAKGLHLTGFCLPGKPGIICLEGLDTDCDIWWRCIRSLTWKKINLKNTEIFDSSQKSKEQKFKTFEELQLPRQGAKASKHSNMSEFSKFMEDYGLLHKFNEIFGFTTLGES